ncbi:MAG: MATE family efflux transporter [Lachnospiraceae bacterium]|nr:MATE family efflux transporter [Lachnospiraceae bacterium]
MTETPVPKLIKELAIPTVISMLVTGIYNTADTYFVGRIPDIAIQATAAVGIVFPVMAVIQAFGFLFGHGSGNFLSRMLGAGKKQEANEMATTGFVLAILIGVLAAVFGNIFIDGLIGLLVSSDVSASTVEMTKSYAGIILFGAPFMMGQFVVNNQLRFQGSAVYAMIGLVSGAVINMVLDPLLILGFGMGIKGAAIATVVGQITSFFILLTGSRKGENIRVNIKNLKINSYYILQIINGGIPSLFRQGLAAIATTLLNRTAGDLGGDAAISGMSITTRVMMLLISALIGFGQGYQPVCSFNYGAGKKDRVKEGFYFCVKWGTIFLLVIGAVCFIFAPGIIELFISDSDNTDMAMRLKVIEVGKTALRCQSVILPLNAFIVMTNMMLQSIGKGVRASITASARNGLFFIPAVLILPAIFGLTGVEITQSVADIFTFGISIPFAIIELKQMGQEVKE